MHIIDPRIARTLMEARLREAEDRRQRRVRHPKPTPRRRSSARRFTVFARPATHSSKGGL